MRQESKTSTRRKTVKSSIEGQKRMGRNKRERGGRKGNEEMEEKEGRLVLQNY